jgi:diaminohydroxyphosphoribosylaminopyrimidine deaminase/5-amino-6-(5-phosphoribosylamino)uracil reductase
MLRAVELARNGLGLVSPNPMVGCVITRNNVIIGEGWHQKFGGPHAEVNAINSVEDGMSLHECELFVTLEPCSHFGKTPPCTDLIIKNRIGTVYIANNDPNPLVAGQGIKKLAGAGIKVIAGFCEPEAGDMNRRYLSAIMKNRPYIILKWAQTRDGFIAKEDYDSKWISNDYSRQIVHKWRSEEDAVLAGYNTVKYDNPRLNVRNWDGRNPVRIIIDLKKELDEGLQVFDRSQRTIVFNYSVSDSLENLEYVKISKGEFPGEMLSHLVKTGIHSILVEGGRATLQAFIDQNVWDESRVFISGINYSRGIKAPQLSGGQLTEEKQFMTDWLYVYRNISIT